jgi:hypothetical protein
VVRQKVYPPCVFNSFVKLPAAHIKEMLVYSQTALWQTEGETPVEIRYVITRDPEGKLCDEFFATTKLDATVEQILEWVVAFLLGRRGLNGQSGDGVRRIDPRPSDLSVRSAFCSIAFEIECCLPGLIAASLLRGHSGRPGEPEGGLEGCSQVNASNT